MKVQNDNKTSVLDSLVRSSQVKSSKDTANSAKVDGNATDTVELSSRKEEIQRIKDRVMAAPDVRQEKVDKVQAELSAQTYNPKGELVAKSILKSQLLDEVL
jgi:flagellar biosynthesis anti-sigma factor FlgM